MRPRMGTRSVAGDLVGPAQARVELLEQEGEADAGEEADAQAEDRGAPRVGRVGHRGHLGLHQDAVVARGGGLADDEVLQALLEHEVVGRLLRRLRVLAQLRLDGVGGLLDLRLLALLAPVHVGGGVGVGRRRGQFRILAAGGDEHHVAAAAGVAAVARLRAGGDRVAGGVVDALLLEDGAGALLHLRAGEDVVDGGHLAVERIGVRVALAQRVVDADALLVDERGGRLVLLGLARRVEVGAGGGDHDDEQDDPLAPPEHAEVVAQREPFGLELVRCARRRAGGHVRALAVAALRDVRRQQSPLALPCGTGEVLRVVCITLSGDGPGCARPSLLPHSPCFRGSATY